MAVVDFVENSSFAMAPGDSDNFIETWAIHRVLVKGIDNAGCWPVAGVKCSGRGAGGAGRGTGLAPPRE